MRFAAGATSSRAIPSSLVFLQLGERCVGTARSTSRSRLPLRGLERHPQNVEGHDLVARIAGRPARLREGVREWEVGASVSTRRTSAR
jgi:hypothetical protein